MAYGGFVLGGLLSGVGKGMEAQALQAREDALERLRNQRQLEGEGRLEQRTIAAEGRGEERSNRAAERDYGIKTGLLGQTAEIEKGKMTIEQKNKLELEDHKARLDERLTAVKADLDKRNDAASQRLKASLESGEIDDVLVDDNGNYVQVTKGGKMTTTAIKARPLSAASTEGGRLTESEQTTAYQEARRQWRQNGEKGEPPRQSDFIGMSREDYQAQFGKGRGATTSSSPETKPKGKTVSAQDRANLYNEASSNPQFKGLSAQQIKAKVDRMLRNQGYDF